MYHVQPFHHTADPEAARAGSATRRMSKPLTMVYRVQTFFHSADPGAARTGSATRQGNVYLLTPALTKKSMMWSERPAGSPKKRYRRQWE
mmetsp:Transcript_5775/g.16766  ORF Transcript_5775/g.16766 Transcript_5775/m.16766 type:complete len:90 (-) Transcript_5775:398-667(-)